MTTEQHPPAPRPTGRRPWFWVVIAAAAVVVVGVAVLIGVGMTNNEHGSAGGSDTPHALLTTMLRQTNGTAVAAGGTWAYEDKSAWDPKDTSGYFGQPCPSSAPGAQYSVDIYSAGVADPAAAAAKIAKYWQGLGYPARTVVPTQKDGTDFTQIAADLTDGSSLGYTVSKKISGIQGASACSNDPGLSTKTK